MLFFFFFHVGIKKKNNISFIKCRLHETLIFHRKTAHFCQHAHRVDNLMRPLIFNFHENKQYLIRLVWQTVTVNEHPIRLITQNCEGNRLKRGQPLRALLSVTNEVLINCRLNAENCYWEGLLLTRDTVLGTWTFLGSHSWLKMSLK